MPKTKWKLPEILRLKKIYWVQSNLFLVVFFGLFIYVEKNVVDSVFVGLFCAYLWIHAAITFYTLKTGKTIGTKTGRLVVEFHKDRWGEERWKREKKREAVSAVIMGVVFTAFWFAFDFSSSREESFNYYIFIVFFIAFNAREISRMKKLKREVPAS